MDIHKNDLPATLQAFELLDNKEIFLAEQVVNNQAEIDVFTSRYAGKLIKAKTTVSMDNRSSSATGTRGRSQSGIVATVIIILIILALVIYGFSTGWLQEKLHLKV